MRVLLVLAFAGLLSFLSFKLFKKRRIIAIILSTFIGLFALVFIAATINPNKDLTDGWCGKYHDTEAYPPENPTNAMDYFEQANYEFDIGNCAKAIEEYSKSIELNPNYAQAYNNRGYTHMRLREFDKALPDLNMAININPNYVNALRNRADVYSKIQNYDKAKVDYERAIELGGSNDLCGDLFTATHGKEFLNGLFSFPKFMLNCARRN